MTSISNNPAISVRADRPASPSDHHFIRKAEDSDLAQLPLIESAADAVFHRSGLSSLPPPAPAEVYRESLFVIVAGNPPIGFARVIAIDGEAHLEQMSVEPDHMGKGTGSALLHSCIEAARGDGYSRLTLITFANVEWNAPFYLRRGFSVLLQLTPGLKWLREREKMLGLDRVGERVVLALELTEDN